MQFSAQEDIEAPIAFVFAQVSDFAALERAALQRGARVRRTDLKAEPGPGLTWQASYDLPRTPLNLTLELTQFDPPNGMVVDGRSAMFDGLITLELVALTPSRTRLGLRVDVRARTWPARLFLQSFKVARAHPGVTVKRLTAAYAARIEERYKSRV